MTAGDEERIFITGGDGFLGRYLARAILDARCRAPVEIVRFEEGRLHDR